MLISKDDERASLEDELEALFHETAYLPEQRVLHQAARVAAQLPTEPRVSRARWWWRIRFPAWAAAGALCLLVGISQWESLSEPVVFESSESWQMAAGSYQGRHALDSHGWDDLNLLSAGDLGFELLDLPAAESDLAAWEEAYEDVLEEI